MSNIVSIPKQATAIQTNFAPSNFNELIQFAKIAAASNFVPASYNGKPENIMIAIQMGAELGLPPMQSLQNIAVINGKPSIYGDAMLAVCKASPLCEWITEEIIGDKKENWIAICTVKRRGNPEVVSKFSWKEAIEAGLTSKPGPWKNYPKRMLQMRARGFALRDAFPDLLNGLISQEEAQDYPTLTSQTPSVQENTPQIDKSSSIQEMPSATTEKSELEEKYNWLVGQLTDIESRAKLEKLTANPSIIKLRAELKEKEPKLAGIIDDLVSQALHTFEQDNMTPPAGRFDEDQGVMQHVV